MASKKQNVRLEDLVKNLERSFQRWDDIFEHGCNDPFHCDGVNLNLVRNHIFSWKRQIDELLKDEQENTLFPSSYPDIYYKPTPEEVSYDYMAKPEAIRARACEQLALYEQDPNFCYIRDHYKEAFPNGETKATKAAGLSPGKYTRFTRLLPAIERDNLVDMRCFFRVPYEENIKELSECANELRNYLNLDHSQSDNTPIVDDFYEDECEDMDLIESGHDEDSEALYEAPDVSLKKSSLDEQLKAAKIKADKQEKQAPIEWGEQLSLF